jgi:hypothetical protein
MGSRPNILLLTGDAISFMVVLLQCRIEPNKTYGRGMSEGWKQDSWPRGESLEDIFNPSHSHFETMKGHMLKNALFVLLMACFIGLSAIATVQTFRVFYQLALVQVEHDLMSVHARP